MNAVMSIRHAACHSSQGPVGHSLLSQASSPRCAPFVQHCLVSGRQPRAPNSRQAQAASCREIVICWQPFRKLGHRRCTVGCRAEATNNGAVRADSVSVVLLAGGSGKRMGAAIPKQYLELAGQPIAMYSFQIFAKMPEVLEIIVVCSPAYRALFEQYYDLLQRKPRLIFAEPGLERQDSVNNGFKAIDRDRADVVAIHDSARPLITTEDALQCVRDALEVGAAVLGVPVKPTIKEVDGNGKVIRTLKRANLWEVQTPQVIRPNLLQSGFELVQRENLEVTDDVSIIEALGQPVKLTKGSYTNLKVTTPDDLLVAEGFLLERGDAIDSTTQPGALPARELLGLAELVNT